MDFDRHQFLTAIFEKLVDLAGDPVRQMDHAVAEVIEAHVAYLRKVAQQHRVEVIEMAEERKATGQMVRTRWT